jgi:hypothetical protein
MLKPEAMYRPNLSTPRLVVEQFFTVIHRGVDHLIRPERDSFLDFFDGIGPHLPSIIESLSKVMRPPIPMDTDGPNVKQVRQELRAEEAHLDAEHAEKRARLVAEFGPRFDKAQRIDNLDLAIADNMKAAPAG